MSIEKIIKLANRFQSIMIKKSISYCETDLSDYNSTLKKKLDSLLQSSRDAFEKAKKANPEDLVKRLKSYNIRDEELFQIIREKNDDEVFSKIINLEIPTSLKIEIENYCFSSQETFDQDFDKDFEKLSKETKENMDKICSLINSSISRIPKYKGTIWKIIPYSAGIEESCKDAQVISSKNKDVFFSLFFTGEKFEIDEVIEDIGEFEDSSWQSDYYNLVNEIRKPGSSSVSKMLTLYTARPTKDREMYRSARNLPKGIYLTNKEDSACGLAVELAKEKDERRDVWMVRVDRKDLLQTLEGHEKHYVVISEDGAPVETIELIQEGEVRNLKKS